jgi:hypothetical protein
MEVLIQTTNNNMKQLLIDHTSFKIAKLTLMTEGKSTNGRMLLQGKLQEAEVKNGNGRVYPRNILNREVEKYIDGPVKQNNAMGELDHPEASIINLSNVSHNIKKVWWDGNDLMGQLELLNTPSGKIAMELVSAGIPLGISSRGMGSVKQLGETVEVQDDFELLCWDLVSVPSTPGAYMQPVGSLSSIKEGKQYKATKDYSKVNSLITEIICSQTGVCVFCP